MTQDYLYDLAKSVENLGPESRDLHLAALEVCGSILPVNFLRQLHTE